MIDRRMFFFVLAVALLGISAGSSAAQTPQPSHKYALLVGCTQYPNHPDLATLFGPANDLPLWSKLLTDKRSGFAFPHENVTELLGWPDQSAKRPTYANIVKGFEDLVAKATSDAQIVIVLSGHGTQVPIPKTQKDPLDPKNPEPDGLDEVFLPADVKRWSEDSDILENGIKDDQIGIWLDQMRNKGASVWIVFDCCHSGTMTRGGAKRPSPDDVEISRFANPMLLGVSPEAIDAAVRRAQVAVKNAEARGERPLEAIAEKLKPRKNYKGSLVAFYACQPFEEAPEFPPEGMPLARKNNYGLLSYTLIECLQRRRSPITYRELYRLLATQYRALRGTEPPSPLAEGDLDREVLGLNVWPERSAIVLERFENKLQVNAGELVGLTPGSILAVHPPSGDVHDSKEILGYVQVATSSPLSAFVKPCAFAGKQPIAADSLRELSWCEVVSRDFGDMRVKIFAEDVLALRGILDKLTKEVRVMVSVSSKEADAEWILRTFSPRKARDEFGIEGLAGDHVLLLQGQSRKRFAGQDWETLSHLRNSRRAVLRKVYAKYPVADEKALIVDLERDLPKIFKWKNVWRVANGVQTQDGGETHGLLFEVAKLKNENDRSGGQLLRDGVLRSGQEMEFRLKNGGKQDLWVTILYLEANLGIEIYQSVSLEQGKALEPIRTTMAAMGDSFGMEGMVVFAVPMSVQREKPDFRLLEQTPLSVSARTGIARGTPTTPFERLMTAAALNEGSRDIPPRVPTTPAILSQSWMLIPE